LYPLQLGQTDVLFLIIAGIILAGIVIAVIIFALRRATTASNELPEQARVKFEAIKPTPQEETPKETQPPPRTRPVEPQAPESRALMADLRENSRNLQQQMQEMLALKEREVAKAKEIEKLRTEISMLRDQISSSRQELGKLTERVEKQNIGLLNQRRDMETQERRFNEALDGLRRELTEKPPQPPASYTLSHPEPPPMVSQAREESGISRFFDNMLGRKSCPHCGHQLRIQDRYCDACGQPLVGTTSRSV
jgi:DNA gyrase/topoisomerase IV subunit A